MFHDTNLPNNPAGTEVRHYSKVILTKKKQYFNQQQGLIGTKVTKVSDYDPFRQTENTIIQVTALV